MPVIDVTADFGTTIGTRNLTPASGRISPEQKTAIDPTSENSPPVALGASLKNVVPRKRIIVATDGTGQLNCDGIADDVEINKALQIIGGGDAFVRPGIYNLDAPLYVPSHTSLIGLGSSTILRFSGHGGFNWLIENSDGNRTVVRDADIVLANFTLDGNRGQRGTGGIGFRNVDRVSLLNLTIINANDDGIIFNALSVGGGTATDVTIAHVRVSGCGADGISIFGVTRLNMDDVLLRSNGDRVNGYGMTLGGSHNASQDNYYMSFQDVIADQNRRAGVFMAASHSVTWRDSVFTNNGEDGLQVGQSEPSDHVVITNSTSSGNALQGFHVNNLSYDIRFDNCKSNNNGRNGWLVWNARDIVLRDDVSFKNGYNGVYLGGDGTNLLHNATIIGGTFYDNSQNEPHKYAGLRIEGWRYSNIMQVKSFDDQPTKSQGYGIYADGLEDYNSIVNSVLGGNAVASIHTVGAHDLISSNSI